MKHVKPPKREEDVELETQFILRLPEEPAKTLREAIQSGSTSLKERLFVKLERPDLRYGEVKFDHWLLHAKLVDLPTIIESLKTIDNKSFYKTADICQMVICKEEPDTPSADEESPNKAKKKDSNKVDKKFLWPHGVTPPCKNVRKRRFRKTLKKKYVEAPEIEKEVKRLLRVDNDAVQVKYEIIQEDEEQAKNNSGDTKKDLDNYNDDNDNKLDDGKEDKIDASKDGSPDSDVEDKISLTQGPTPGHVAEHDIFGGEVSSTDEEDNDNTNVARDLEDISRLSADDSRISEFSLTGATAGGGNNNVSSQRSEGQAGNYNDKIITEFNKSMFNSPKSSKASSEQLSQSQENSRDFLSIPGSSSAGGQSSSQKNRAEDEDTANRSATDSQMSREQLTARITDLRRQCDDLRIQQAQKAQEISSIQNPTLRQRMQETLDNLLTQIYDKEMMIQELQNLL